MRNKRLCLAVCSIQCFMLGFESAGLQYVLQRRGAAFGASQSVLGNLVALQYLALMTVPMLFGRFSDRYGKHYSAALSCVFYIVGCLIIVNTSSVFVLGIGIFLCGSGYGVCETTGVAALFDLYPGSSDRKITFTQALFSLGGVLAPFFIEHLIVQRGFQWSVLFYLLIFFQALLIVPAYLVFPKENAAHSIGAAQEKGRTRIAPFLTGAILFLCVALIGSSGLENGFTYFLGLFTIDVLDAPSATAGALSLFWLTNVIIRLIYSAVSSVGSRTLLIYCYGISAVFLALLAALPSVPLLYVVSAAFGCLLAPMWPIIQSRAMMEFPENSATVSGIMSIPSGAGAVIFLMLSGKLSDSVGVRAAYICLAGLAAIGMAAYIGYLCTSRRKRT